jgi:hypothetical protein
MVTQHRLKDLLIYDENSGIFYWKNPTASWIKPGDIAGGLESDGAIRIKIDGKLYLAHRLAWFFFYGKWPDGCLDHINRKRADNRIKNLRLATRSENGQNSNVRKDNRSGTTGVFFRPDTGKWRAVICVNQKKVNLGSFDSKLSAIAARKIAEKKYFPFKVYSEGRIEEEMMR